jgi:hypothetical protein
MMSGVPLETRWTFIILWNKKFYYKAASYWYFYWVNCDAQIHEYQIMWISSVSCCTENPTQWHNLGSWLCTTFLIFLVSSLLVGKLRIYCPLLALTSVFSTPIFVSRSPLHKSLRKAHPPAEAPINMCCGFVYKIMWKTKFNLNISFY